MSVFLCYILLIFNIFSWYFYSSPQALGTELRDDFQPLFIPNKNSFSAWSCLNGERDSLAQLVIDFPHTALKVQSWSSFYECNAMQKAIHRPLKTTSREDGEEPTKPSELNAESIEMLTITRYNN